MSPIQDATHVEDPIQNMINDAFRVDMHHSNEVPIASNVEIDFDEEVMPNATQERHALEESYELEIDGEQPLYEGCAKYSRLSFLVKLYHIKCLCGMSDKAMTMILELLKDAFEHAKIPSSLYEAKKTITKLGLNYENISTKRRALPRCQSTPNEQNKSSLGTMRSAKVCLSQSEPIPNIGSSSQGEVHVVSATQFECRRSRHRELDVAKDSSTVQKNSPTYWNVDVINEDSVVTKTQLRVQDVFATRDATKVVTRWNAKGRPIGESAGLLAGFLGEVANNFNNFPIMYETWKKVPREFKNNVYNQIIKAKFEVNDQEHKKFILGSLGKKWLATWSRVFNKNYNWEISVEENCQKHPPDIDANHWRLFVQYKMSPNQMEILDKNAANREKLLIPHTPRSKTLARKRDELEMQCRRSYRIGDMHLTTHKSKDRSFVNEEAREKYEQLHNEIQESSFENDAFQKVFVKEHPRYVQSIGLEVTPTQIIGSCSYSVRSESSSEATEIAQLQHEINTLKERLTEVDVLKEQLAFLMQYVRGNQVAEMESPKDLRQSSGSSHVP